METLEHVRTAIKAFKARQQSQTWIRGRDATGENLPGPSKTYLSKALYYNLPIQVL